MIILTSSDKIQVVLNDAATANQLPCYASFRDTSSGATLVPGRALVNTNDTTLVDFVTAPASGDQRGIDFISIQNTDTATAVVTVRYNAGGTGYTLKNVSIGVGESLEYNTNEGWRVIANSGAVKHSINQGNTPVSSTWNQVVLTSDIINNNATANTLQYVTGLTFAVTTGNRYKFRAFIWFTSAATSTGSRWTIDGPASTNIVYMSTVSLAATTQTTNHGLTAFNLPAASSASSASVNGNIAIIEGEFTAAGNGDAVIRFASKISGSAITAKAGSTLEWIAVL